ncbi:MAG: carboxylating nicotinate-nucleotide diphosphorylase [Propionibacteriaceae bacterium]|jgi:nicotinate-nucleotide pyrophosphorylase (carboxylating)|nr:carboxylating nicotinate-nucleotide diphosphorylase [Propionibacteriaceae bacterium]
MSGLSNLLVEPLVRAALLEDMGRQGDITSAAVIDAKQVSQVALVAREPGVVSGTACAALAWELIDPQIQVEILLGDGSQIQPGDTVGRARGKTRALLTGERVALNFLSHLSGVATATAAIVRQIAHTKARVVDTRKTIPGLRALQKAAVVSGGGANHRFGLDDAVLIKDNHIAAAGSLTKAVQLARKHVGHLMKIEVEVDTLDQLRELLAVGADAVLLDNMDPKTLRKAVALVDGRLITEASGRITADTAKAVAESGVDLISVGWLTHSVKVLDFGLDYIG